MVGWIIFFCLLAIILFILFMPAVVDFSYENNKTTVRVSYCGFTIVDTAKKKKELTDEEKEAARKKKEQKQKKKEEKEARKKKRKEERARKKGKKIPEETPKKKKSIGEILELVRSLLSPVGHGMRRLFKGIRITRFYLDIKVGAFDAYDCALAYGKICTLVSNMLAFFQSFFVIKPNHIKIEPRFSTESTVYIARFRAKLSPAAVLAAGISLGWTYLMQTLRRDSSKPQKKTKNQPT